MTIVCPMPPPGTACAQLPPVRYIGDDWSFPYAYVNPDGSALDITGATPVATLFARDRIAAVVVMQGQVGADGGATIVDAPGGKVVFTAPKALTSTLRADGDAEGYPTRIQVQLIDASGALTTHALQPVLVDDPRFARIG